MPSANNVIRPEYITLKFDIDKNTINNFFINERDRRKIRNGEVIALCRKLEAGMHFASPIVVNRKDFNKMSIIDGNHRYEAMKMFLQRNPNKKVIVWAFVYDNLNETQEREVYKTWNIGIAQTATDFLKAYYKTIPQGQYILRKLPVSIYGDGKTKMPMKHLIGAYINAKKQGIFEGGYSVGKEQTVKDFQDLITSDIDEIFEFCEWMKAMFGPYNGKQSSMYYKTTPVCVFMRLWYDNRDLGEELLSKIFVKTFNTNLTLWSEQTSSGGRAASLAFYGSALNALNRTIMTSMSKRLYNNGLKILSDEDIAAGKDDRAKAKLQQRQILEVVGAIKTN